MASFTLVFIVIIRSVSVLASVEREAGSGQKRIAVSGRSKTASGSARLIIPARRLSASTTGSRLTLRLPMSRAASSTASSVFWSVSAAEDDLEGAGVRGPGEDVVRRFHLIQAEMMGDEPLGVDLAAGDQPHQGRGGGGVLQARGDRYVPGPLFVQVQRDGSAVHANIRDPAARPDQLDRQLEGGREPDGFDGHVRAEPPG